MERWTISGQEQSQPLILASQLGNELSVRMSSLRMRVHAQGPRLVSFEQCNGVSNCAVLCYRIVDEDDRRSSADLDCG